MVEENSKGFTTETHTWSHLSLHSEDEFIQQLKWDTWCVCFHFSTPNPFCKEWSLWLLPFTLVILLGWWTEHISKRLYQMNKPQTKSYYERNKQYMIGLHNSILQNTVNLIELWSWQEQSHGTCLSREVQSRLELLIRNCHFDHTFLFLAVMYVTFCQLEN